MQAAVLAGRRALPPALQHALPEQLSGQLRGTGLQTAVPLRRVTPGCHGLQHGQNLPHLPFGERGGGGPEREAAVQPGVAAPPGVPVGKLHRQQHGVPPAHQIVQPLPLEYLGPLTVALRRGQIRAHRSAEQPQMFPPEQLRLRQRPLPRLGVKDVKRHIHGPAYPDTIFIHSRFHPFLIVFSTPLSKAGVPLPSFSSRLPRPPAPRTARNLRPGPFLPQFHPAPAQAALTRLAPRPPPRCRITRKVSIPQNVVPTGTFGHVSCPSLDEQNT